MPDTSVFESCRQEILQGNYFQSGVGSLGEKSLHATLKNYYCPNPANQEINIGAFVADIADESGIIEIQTSGFGRLRKKLELFLTYSPVRIVYPVAQLKWLCWLDPVTGEVSGKRKSPKKNGIYSLFRELYSLGGLISHPGLSFTVALLEVEEIRILNGWSADRKRGSHKSETIPLRLLGEVEFHSPSDFQRLLPGGLPQEFISKDLQRLTKLSQRQTFYMITILKQLGLLEQCGKKGRSYLYQAVPPFHS